MPRFSSPSIAALGTALLLALAAPAAWAQAFCSSDGQAAPVALVERFLSADCESCWSSTPVDVAAANELALDWIVPSARGDDAPLSAAASRDSAARLAALGLEALSSIESRRHAIAAPRAGGKGRQPLRVAHGLPFNDYLGASLTLDWPRSAQRQAPPQAWLVLIETVPAGADGTPVERNLVRNVV